MQRHLLHCSLTSAATIECACSTDVWKGVSVLVYSVVASGTSEDTAAMALCTQGGTLSETVLLCSAALQGCITAHHTHKQQHLQQHSPLRYRHRSRVLCETGFLTLQHAACLKGMCYAQCSYCYPCCVYPSHV
jgi:hypothetical protein